MHQVLCNRKSFLPSVWFWVFLLDADLNREKCITRPARAEVSSDSTQESEAGTLSLKSSLDCTARPHFFFKFTHDKPSEFLVGESLSVANILRTHKNQTTNQPTKRKKKPKPQDMFSSLIMSLTFSTQPPHQELQLPSFQSLSHFAPFHELTLYFH